MKGEILSVEKVFDNTCMLYKWQVFIEFDERPPFEVGDCEVKQK